MVHALARGIPEELLLYIISNVTSDNGSHDTATLMTLSTVSRQFRTAGRIQKRQRCLLRNAAHVSTSYNSLANRTRCVRLETIDANRKGNDD